MLTADDWPIAAALLPFPDAHPGDGEWSAELATRWRRALRSVADCGFDDADLTDSWLRPGDLTPRQRSGLLELARETGLRFRSVSAIRRSVIDEAAGDENLAYAHRTLEAAAALGCAVVSFGLHRALTDEQRRRLWFWTAPGHRDRDEPDVRRLAVRRFRELGSHAADLGLLVSLELYEDTLLGTGASSVDLAESIGMPNVGLNPDLGNLVRAHGPIEDWRELASATLPWTNFWHVKNYLRDEAADGRAVVLPSYLEQGIIDYRSVIATALDSGFQGVICVEHYGGDGLSMSAAARDYLRSRALPRRADYGLGESRVIQRVDPAPATTEGAA